MNNLHYDLEKHLSEIDSSFTIVEALGYLTGYASSNCSFDSYLEGLITYFSSDSNPSADKIDIELIKNNIELIKQDLENNSLVLFFNEEDDLSSKLLSLSDWSRNYILSINYLIDNKLLKNTIILQEILHDFAEISKITTDYSLDDDDDALDNSYKQISNYVVASSYDIYNGSKEEIFKNE